MERTIKHFRGLILEYQKLNNIKNACVNNSVCLYDILDQLYPSMFKVVVGVMTLEYETSMPCIVVHCWIEQQSNNRIIECSYEFINTTNRIYHSSMSNFIANYKLDTPIALKAWIVEKICGLSKVVNTMLKNPNATNDNYKSLTDYIRNHNNSSSI